MRVLFDINHPAQVHKLKNVIFCLKEDGHSFFVLSRHKNVLTSLLNHYNIPHLPISSYLNWPLSYYEAGQRFLKTYQNIKRFKPDVLIGFSAWNLCVWGKLLKIKTILLADTEYVPFISNLTFPYANRIVIPSVFQKSFPGRERRFKGSYELSYLKDFKPDSNVYDALNVDKSEPFVLIRFIFSQSIHDNKDQGFTLGDKVKLVKSLEKEFKVFISSDGKLPEVFEKYKLQAKPEQIHSVMYYAEMFICESQSMATEAALLGTPAIRYTKLVGSGHGDAQFAEYQASGLVYSYNDINQFLERVNKVILMKNRKKVWKERLANYLADKSDPSLIVLDELYS